MSNWFDENDHTENTQNGAPEHTDAAQPTDAADAAGKQETAASDTWNLPSEPTVPATPSQTVVPPVVPPTSSAASGSYGYHYTGYTAPQPQQQPAQSQQPAQPQQPYRAGYPNTGWQQPNRPLQPNMPTPPQPPRKKGSGTKVLIAVLSIVCAAAVITAGVLAVQVMSKKGGSSSSSGSSSSTSQSASGAGENAPELQISSSEITDGGLSTQQIVANNLSSTVVLSMYQTQTSSYGFSASSELTQVGAASGIIMTADGYIITNSHCVADEDTNKLYDRVDVTTYDGTVYTGAKVIGYDPKTDLAVIKIEATGLTPAQFGDSSKLSLGERVVTIGNSGGLEWSVSQGIVSGLARDVYDDTGYAIKCLQVDATINPGSSGGPLCNINGQVVGINSAKIVATGYEGIGFSIPINEAKEVINSLLQYGYVPGRVTLGVEGQTVTTLGYEGFIIRSISSASPLANTNARIGDIITKVGDTRVKTYGELRSALAEYAVGDTVTLTLLRVSGQTNSQQTLTVTCTLAESKN